MNGRHSPYYTTVEEIKRLAEQYKRLEAGQLSGYYHNQLDGGIEALCRVLELSYLDEDETAYVRRTIEGLIRGFSEDLGAYGYLKSLLDNLDERLK